MMLSLRRYFQALGLVTAALIIYVLTVARWIEPERTLRPIIPNLVGLTSGPRWWEPLFAKDSWQNQEPTVARGSRGVLLAKSWEQIDQRTWRLTPMTIVLSETRLEPDGSAPGLDSHQVWIIDAHRGATILFDQPLDLNSGRVPSIHRGQLEGEIRIRRMPLDPPSQPTLEMVTSNISMDRRQIWTQDEVSLTTSDLVLQGRTLRIQLLGDILSSENIEGVENGIADVPVLEEIELMHLNELKMRLGPGGIWAGLHPNLFPDCDGLIDRPAEIDARCGGRFSVNFGKATATLTGGVQVQHRIEGYPPDEFHCHRVHFKFQTAPFASAGGDLSSRIQSGLSIREIEAFGMDSLENFVGETWVQIHCPTVRASARAKRLRVDLKNQRLELAGRLNQPGATVSVAEIDYRGYHLRAPSIEYQAAPRGSDPRSQHAGWMVAQGEGELSAPAESALGEVQIRWQERFQWSPSDQATRQRIEIVGQTLLESKQHGFLTSDRIQVWMRRSDEEQALPPPGRFEAPRLGNYKPDRLVSPGPAVVGFQNHRMHVNHLDLTFQYPLASVGDGGSDLSLKDSAGNPMFQFVQPPQTNGAWIPSSSGGLPFNDFRITGKGMVASITVSRTPWVEAMTLYGPFSIESTNHSAADGREPIEISGQILILAGAPDGNLDVEIEGNPARMSISQGLLEAPSIRINQRDNLLWIDQPGQCLIPTSILAGMQPAGNFQWLKPLHCDWQGRMMFDGKVIRFDQDIRLSGTLQSDDSLWMMEGFCQTMAVRLDGTSWSQSPEGLPPSGSRTPLAAIDQPLRSRVAEISLSQQVDLRLAQRDTNGMRLSLHRLQVPELKIYVPEEKLVAMGPGRGLSKFQAGRSLGSLAGSVEANGTTLQCCHIDFRDSLTGLLDQREIVADGNVRVFSSPISTWDEISNPEAATRLTPGQMSMASDQLKVFDTSSMNATRSDRSIASGDGPHRFWEVQASGHVVFEGCAETGLYSGQAHQVSYVHSKDLLTLRGDGRSKATLRRTPPAGVQSRVPSNSANSFPTVIQVPVATLNVKTMAVDVPQGGLDLQIDFQQGLGQQLPTGSDGQSSSPSRVPQTPNPRDSIKNFLRGY